MKFEQHGLDTKRLPFIFRCDIARRGMMDYTHWHENIEILYFTEGEGDVLCNFASYPVTKDDIFIVNSENMHMVESNSFVRYYCFIIDSDFCNQNGIPTQSLKFKRIIRDENMLERAKNLAKTFEDEKAPFREANIKFAVLSLLTGMLGFIDNSEDEPESEKQNLANIKLAVKYIKEHFTERITIDDISFASGLSRAYFSRKFKDITGFTIVNYVNLVRCQNACKMLRTGKYKINEVALACGFENMSYFTRTYKKLMGELPSKENEAEK